MITTVPQNSSAGVSENVTFQCVAIGNRVPNIMWVRQDEMRFPDSVVRSENIISSNLTITTSNLTITTSNLTITNVTVNDFTNYSCLAENVVADNTIEMLFKSDIANFTLYEAGKFLIYVCFHAT